MTLLAISIVIALLITIGLPIAAGIWLTKKTGLSWHMITYGVTGYFIVQLLVTIAFSGLNLLFQNIAGSFADETLLTAQIILSIFLGALFGVLVRWAGMKYLKIDLDTPKSALGLGIGYGGAESIALVGLPLLTTFITMLSNRQIDPQTTTLDPEAISQIEALWQVAYYIPLLGALERITAFVMHITVTMLVFTALRRKRYLWLAAAFGLEFIINGLIAWLAEVGLQYGWLVFITFGFMCLNAFILFRLGVFKSQIFNTKNDPENEVQVSDKAD